MDHVILETERLILRKLRPDDLDDLCALYSDPAVRRYFPEGTLTREQTKAELDWFVGSGDPAHSGLGLWATVEKSSGAFIGRCGLLPWTLDGEFMVEIAYLLAPSHWRRGLGTEIARGLVRHGFETLDLKRLVAFIAEENEASKRTAINAGLRFDAIRIVEDLPCAVYAIER